MSEIAEKFKITEGRLKTLAGKLPDLCDGDLEDTFEYVMSLKKPEMEAVTLLAIQALIDAADAKAKADAPTVSVDGMAIDMSESDVLKATGLTMARAKTLWPKYSPMGYLIFNPEGDAMQWAVEVGKLPFNERTFVLGQVFMHMFAAARSGGR